MGGKPCVHCWPSANAIGMPQETHEQWQARWRMQGHSLACDFAIAIFGYVFEDQRQ